jgi:hypothetical protein
MHSYKDSLFRVFQADVRSVLQRFFENRTMSITAQIAAEFADPPILDRLVNLQLIEHDTETGEFRLDERVERFLTEMLGAAEVAQADWLTGLLEELQRLIEGYRKVGDANKAEPILRRLCRLLHACNARTKRHLEDIKSAVDFDYRTGSDYELKLLKLQWHLERARSYGGAVAELDNHLRNHVFFQAQQRMDLLTLRIRLIDTCGKVGAGLVVVYQTIEEYLNQVLRDHGRARKLIQLRGLIERHEHFAATNLRELAASARGPWFRELRLRTLIEPSVFDERPEMVKRAMERVGLIGSKQQPKRIHVDDGVDETVPPVIDWVNVYETFTRQKSDLFTFLEKVHVEGRLLTEEERIDGYCTILTNEDWAGAWDNHLFEMMVSGVWEFAKIDPPQTT